MRFTATVAFTCLAFAGTLRAQEHAGHQHIATPRALVTEQAQEMTMLHLGVSAADLRGQQRYGGESMLEIRLVRRLSAMVHVPGVVVVTPGFTSQSTIGDVSVGLKAALLEYPNGAALSVGAHYHFPTGDILLDEGRGHSAIAPFLLASIPLSADGKWFLQAGSSAHVSLGSKAAHMLHAALTGRHWGTENSAALSWAATARIQPMVEGSVSHYTGEMTAWAVVPQVHWGVSRGVELGVGARIPVHDPTRDYTVYQAGATIHPF